MDSESIKLPKIDFSDLNQEGDSARWDFIKEQVRCALEDFGCFEATWDGIPRSLRESLMDQLKHLFEVPLQNKLRNRDAKPYHGYAGQYSVYPLYESLGIGDALSPGSIEEFTNLMWPEGNPDFSKTMQSFSGKLSELDMVVRKMVLDSLGLRTYVEEHLQNSTYLIRVQKYDPPKGDETQLGMGSHTDKNIVTILYQNEVNGLEILTKQGQWIVPETAANSFVVLSGDTFHAWTNGRLHPVHHRIMMAGDIPRYSIGLFSLPTAGYIVKAPVEMVDEQHPMLFKPHDHYDYLDFCFTEAGRNSAVPIKAFCGVRATNC